MNGSEKMINRKAKGKSKMETSDILLIIMLMITAVVVIFSNQDLAGVLLLLLIIVLPVSFFLYWLDFRKQNRS